MQITNKTRCTIARFAMGGVRGRKGGVGAMNVGHSDERVLGAAREQLGRLVHTDYTVAPYGIYAEVAERLVGLVKGAGKAAFFNSGAEAVENSIKMGRVYTGGQEVISLG